MLFGAILSGVAVFLLVCGVCFLFLGHGTESKLGTERESTTIYESIGHVFIPRPEKFLEQAGFSVERWKIACQINNEEFNPSDVAAKKLIGYGFFVLGIVLSVCLTKTPIVFGVSLFGGIFVAILFSELPFRLKRRKAERIRAQVESELPRFMDLLEIGMSIDLPIDLAIRLTAENLDGRLAEEIVAAVQKAETSNRKSLVEILRELAEKYSIDSLTELVMDITIAVEKGINMQEIIQRKNAEIKQTHIIEVKERATKVSSDVLIPLVIFKMVPLLAFMLIPLFLQVLKLR